MFNCIVKGLSQFLHNSKHYNMDFTNSHDAMQNCLFVFFGQTVPPPPAVGLLFFIVNTIWKEESTEIKFKIECTCVSEANKMLLRLCIADITAGCQS